MRPKGKLLALVVMFAAVGLITATGAFTTVEAQRTADVDVASDANALLALEPANNAGSFVSQDSTGQLTIDLTNPGTGAAGLNPNANTTFRPAINATNQGSTQISLSVDINSTNTAMSADNVKLVDSNGNDLTQTSVTLGTGDTITIDLIFDLTSGSGNQVNELTPTTNIGITFNAEDNS